MPVARGDGRGHLGRTSQQQSMVQRTPMPQRPQPTSQQQAAGERPLIPGPRREFVDAFDAPPAPRSPSAPPADPFGSVVEWDERPRGGDRDVAPGTAPATKDGKGAKGRTFTGIAAAAVTTVLAVVVAGQVAHDGGGARAGAAAPTGMDRDGGHDISSRSDDRPTPALAAVKALSYGQKMAKGYPLAPDLQGSGHFEVVPAGRRLRPRA